VGKRGVSMPQAAPKDSDLEDGRSMHMVRLRLVIISMSCAMLAAHFKYL
jgi:hypothetical protein